MKRQSSTNFIKTKPAAKSGYWSLAWLGCGGIALELLISPILRAIWALENSQQYTQSQQMIHILATTIIWFSFGAFIVWYGKRTTSFDPFAPKHARPTKKAVLLASLAAIISVILMSTSWGGFKPLIEYQHLGSALLFVLQYFYYLAEALLLTLMLVYAQKAGDIQFGTRAPWGGLFLAVAWGIFHLSKGLDAGVAVMAMAVMYGVIHWALRRNGRLTYVLIAILFAV